MKCFHVWLLFNLQAVNYLFTGEISRGVRLRPVLSWKYCLICIHHRPIRYRRHGHDGINVAATALGYRAAETGGSHEEDSGFLSSCRHCQVYLWTRARRLPSCGLFQPKSKPIPWKKFLHSSVIYFSWIYKRFRNMLLFILSNLLGILIMQNSKVVYLLVLSL